MIEDPLVRWLLAEAPPLPSNRDVLQGFVDRLNADGFELNRVAVGIGMLHPELLATIYTWAQGARFVARTEIPLGIERTDQYLDSPFRLVNEGHEAVRRRLTGPAAQIDFPVLEEVRDGGGTDYLALGLPRSDGAVNRISFTTHRDGGFTDAEIDRLTELRHVLGVVIELHARADMTRGLLDLYLGQEAGRRVYSGEIRRGAGSTIRSVLWICDLRGFTGLSDRIPLEFLIAVLNDYFEAVTGPIHAHGGEVLKLIGDAVLGIFRIESDAALGETCQQALDAAELALANMRILNRRRAREDKPALGCGIALHVGDAMYGNVGAHDRLDFTVIGPAVNLCARLETLGAQLGEPIVCSKTFADACGAEVKSVGHHNLKNLSEPVEAFVPA